MKDTQLVQITLTDDLTGIITNPIHLSTAYKHPKLGQSTGSSYTRTKNPTRSTFETRFAKLEHDIASFATSSGILVIQLMCSLFKPYDEILASFNLYGGTFRLFEFYRQQYDIKFKYVDFTDYEQIEKEITDKTVTLFIEPVSNPQMVAIDVKPYYQLCKARGLLSVIDNIFLTPYLLAPLAEGAGIISHSATEYTSGHNDVPVGIVTVKDESLMQKLFDLHNMAGVTLPPIDSYLSLHGLKALHLRIEHTQSNARKLVEKCQLLQATNEVLYSGQTGMFSLGFNRAYSVAKLLESLGICIFVESLGGTETSVTFSYTQIHVDMPDVKKDRHGIDEHLIRLSLGVENHEDIEHDIIQASDKTQIGEIV